MALHPLVFRIESPVVTNECVADFNLERPQQIPTLVRSSRMLAALAGMSRKHRVGIGKAIREVARNVISREQRARCEFLVRSNELAASIEYRITLLSGPAVEPVSAIPEVAARSTLVNAELALLATLVDDLESRDWPAEGAQLVMRFPIQALAHAVSANPHLWSDWAAVLAAGSPEESVAICHEQGLQRLKQAESSGELQSLARQTTASPDSDLVQLLSLVAMRTDNAVVLLGAAGDTLWVNDAFSKLTGLTRAEAAGRPIDLLLGGPDVDEAIRRDLQLALRNGQGLTTEVHRTLADGSRVWNTFTLTPVRDAARKLNYWIAIGSDTTQRRLTEEALEASRAAAEAASRSKSDFLANMSHEIRTPMNSIIGMTELALATELNAEQADYLSTAKQSAEHLLQLLNDILDLSKIEAGKLELDVIDFNLADMLRDVLRTLAVQADQKGLDLLWHLPLDIPQWLRADVVRLRQVLVNLVGNAIKFTQRGEIVVSVEKQWQSDREISLLFAVRDTGIGIEPDRLDRIFDAFTQADASTTRKYGGTGLGLTITNQLLRLMDGKIWVESRKEVGSTFYVTLRFGIAAPQRGNARPVPPAWLAGKRVLIVDDNATNRRVLSEFATAWGMHAETADSAANARKILQTAHRKKQPFALLLIDAVMPNVDGFALVEQLQVEPYRAGAAIMMLSSADRSQDAARCREMKVASYLVKPVSPKSLLDAVCEALGREKATLQTEREKPARPVASRSGDVPRDRAPNRILRVLVADDHPANRSLVSSILAKHGHHVEEADNGLEAVRIASQQPFHVILMDVQMPELDGYQATRRIRTREQKLGQYVPIVALTAYAMKGDKEKCLAAGMDAYLSKPVRAADLVSVVENLAVTHGCQSTLSGHPRESVESEAFAEALDRLEGDVDLLKEQMGFFLRDAPQLLIQLRQAVDNQDAGLLERMAHRLKGLLATYDAIDAAQTAAHLEQLGRDGSFEQAEAFVDKLGVLVVPLQDSIRRFLAG